MKALTLIAVALWVSQCACGGQDDDQRAPAAESGCAWVEVGTSACVDARTLRCTLIVTSPKTPQYAGKALWLDKGPCER